MPHTQVEHAEENETFRTPADCDAPASPLSHHVVASDGSVVDDRSHRGRPAIVPTAGHSWHQDVGANVILGYD